jgi:hypothetical protein
MVLVRLQDEIASGKNRDVHQLIWECTRRENDSRKQNPKFPKKVFSKFDQQYQEEVRKFIWSMSPDYFITLNFNFPNDARRQAKQKYRNQRPREGWMKKLDAVFNSRLVKRRINKLLNHMRVSWLAFAEYTTTENLHYHILLALPDNHRFSNQSLTKRQLHKQVRAIITEILEKFFEKASVDVKAIWSKGAIDYATKCVHRSSDFQLTFWHKQSPPPDASPLNMSTEPAIHNNDYTDSLNTKLRHNIKSPSRIASATGAPEPPTEVGRRQIVAADDSIATVTTASHSRTSDPTRRFDFRSYPYGSLIKSILSKARDWFTMPVADG